MRQFLHNPYELDEYDDSDLEMEEWIVPTDDIITGNWALRGNMLFVTTEDDEDDGEEEDELENPDVYYNAMSEDGENIGNVEESDEDNMENNAQSTSTPIPNEEEENIESDDDDEGNDGENNRFAVVRVVRMLDSSTSNDINRTSDD